MYLDQIISNNSSPTSPKKLNVYEENINPTDDSHTNFSQTNLNGATAGMQTGLLNAEQIMENIAHGVVIQNQFALTQSLVKFGMPDSGGAYYWLGYGEVVTMGGEVNTSRPNFLAGPCSIR